jgi:hypothetical protein
LTISIGAVGYIGVFCYYSALCAYDTGLAGVPLPPLGILHFSYLGVVFSSGLVLVAIYSSINSVLYINKFATVLKIPVFSYGFLKDLSVEYDGLRLIGAPLVSLQV